MTILDSDHRLTEAQAEIDAARQNLREVLKKLDQTMGPAVLLAFASAERRLDRAYALLRSVRGAVNHS